MVTVKYTDEGLSDTLYFVRANTDVEAIRKTMNSPDWGPTSEIKSLNLKQLVIVEIDDSVNDDWS